MISKESSEIPSKPEKEWRTVTLFSLRGIDRASLSSPLDGREHARRTSVEVRGLLDEAQHRVLLWPLVRSEGSQPGKAQLEGTGHDQEVEELRIVLETASGLALATTTAAPSRTREMAGLRSFSTALEWNLSASVVKVLRGTQVLAERKRSPNPPTIAHFDLVEDGSSVRWKASDLDGDSLSVSLAYSPTGEAPWRLLGVALDAEESFDLDSSWLQPGPGPRYRLRLSDGFDQIEAVVAFASGSGTLTTRAAPPATSLDVLSARP